MQYNLQEHFRSWLSTRISLVYLHGSQVILQRQDARTERLTWIAAHKKLALEKVFFDS